MLTQIQSDYSGALSTVNLSGTAAVLPTPQAPAMTDNGDSENPVPVAPSTPTVSPALQATEGPSDHGFVVTITGYVPETPGVDLNDVVQEYMKALLSRHPVASAADANTLYYFTDFTTSGLTIPAPAPGVDPATMGDTGSANSPWAKNSGPFKEVYARDLSGAKPLPPVIGAPGAEGAAAQNDTIAQGNFQGPIDAFVRDPNKGIKYMYNYYQFTIQFKVHVK